MSDDEKHPPPSLADSSSSPPLDRSLVRVFGVLEQVLTDLTTASQATLAVAREGAQKVSELSQLLRERGKLDDKQREAVLNALVKLTESVDRLAQEKNVATEEARTALIEVKKQIDERLDTGQHQLLPHDPEGPPRNIQVLWQGVLNVGWKNKAKVAAWIVAGAGVHPGWLKLKLLWAYFFGAH